MLKSWFQKIETSRNYAAKFNNRCQKPQESVEDYAAELKQLYDKAHANQDRATRREDLIHRFLNGLTDDQAKSNMEFVKEPNDVEEAAFEEFIKKHPQANEHCTECCLIKIKH